jgi:hypothetical protein
MYEIREHTRHVPPNNPLFERLSRPNITYSRENALESAIRQSNFNLIQSLVHKLFSKLYIHNTNDSALHK